MQFKQMQYGADNPVICPSCFAVFSKYGVAEDRCPRCNSPFLSSDVVNWVNPDGAWEIARELAKIRMKAKQTGEIKR